MCSSCLAIGKIVLMSNLPYSQKMLELAEKWLKGSITDQERTEFIDWYNHFNDEELLLAPAYQPVIKQLEEEMLISIRRRIAADEKEANHPLQSSCGY